MPRVDFNLWDRVYILKLICTAQMTFSSFVTILYLYLIILQSWSSYEDHRRDVILFKWIVLAITVFDFGMGTLLAFAANARGVCCRRRIVSWIIAETVLIPTGIFLLMRLYYKITKAKESIPTDCHYTRINMVQVCFFICHYFFVAYAIDFLVHRKRKKKSYDPAVRPETVSETDPKITTTESRNIRMSQSFLSQPSTSKNYVQEKEEEDEAEEEEEEEEEEEDVQKKEKTVATTNPE